MIDKQKKEYVIMFDDGTYWCGYNKTDKQLRKARIYTSRKMAIDVANEISCKTSRSYKLLEVELKIVGEDIEARSKSCFWCEHLILDGCNSWCDIHRAGEVCGDYIENIQRVRRCKELEEQRLAEKKT